MAYKLPDFLYAVGYLHDCSLTLHMGYNSLEVKEYQPFSVSLLFCIWKKQVLTTPKCIVIPETSITTDKYYTLHDLIPQSNQCMAKMCMITISLI